MTYQEASKLTAEVVAFLRSCGGVYTNAPLRKLWEVVLVALATEQYILERDGQENISHFICYWKVKPEDMELVEQGGKPASITEGSVLYIVEHGNTTGRHGMMAIVKELRHRAKGMKGVFWMSKGRGIKKFMQQRGE